MRWLYASQADHPRTARLSNSEPKRYKCRDCGKTGKGVQWRFQHYHETYHCVVEDRT
jgi:hypothetical protein